MPGPNDPNNNNPNKNPWGNRGGGSGGGNGGGPRNPWGGGSGGGSGRGPGGGGGEIPPDLEELLKKAQANLRQALPGGFGPTKFIVLGLLAGAALWLSSGFYYVTPGENAVITRFGAWNRTQTEPGLGYRLPYPVEEATVLNVTVDRRVQIGFVDAMGREGTGKRDIPEESLMLTADANIVDLDLVVLWNIENAENYLFKIKDPDATLKKVAESAMREVVGQTNLQPIITGNRNEVATRAQKIMQDTLNTYQSGISIKQVVIQEATVHPDVLDAFEDVVAAIQDAERFQNEANIYRNDIIPKARGEAQRMLQEAEGYRQSTIARAEGDAERFNSVYRAYLEGKDVTRERMYIEAMESVLKNAQKIIMDKDGSDGVVPYLPLNRIAPAAGNATPDAAPAKTTVTP